MPTTKPDHDQTDGQHKMAAEASGFGGSDVLAVLFAVLWVVTVLAYPFVAPANMARPGLVAMLLLIFLPLVLIWMTAATLRSIRILRAEAARLQDSVDQMRDAYLVSQHASTSLTPSVEKKIAELTQVTKQAENALARFTSRRDAGLSVPSADRKAALVLPAPPAPGDDQPGLALGTPAEALRPPLAIADFIRALQFPENAEDREGFRALRAALEDREVAKLIRAAQEVLTLLSQDGIYTEDLRPDHARPELWRRFAKGERGRDLAAVGGVRDRSCLALAAGRMREDPQFRAAVHLFLTTFDKTLAMVEPNATDSELIELSDTRTARAFMLFGRVMGVFD